MDLVYSPFAGRYQVLAQRASANSATGAATTMALILWNHQYYTIVDMVCVGTYSMPVVAWFSSSKGGKLQSKEYNSH